VTTDRDDLAEVGAVVRRSLAARTKDQHLIDDLTQETLLRLADTDRELSADEQRAYAVVIARNLLTSHFRGRSVQIRHLHRLIEHDDSTDPEQRTIDKEETEALASALTHIDPDERDLLVRHEVSGTDLATLADEAQVSRGAIAMRLARARANLRLEFLLVFRRLTLPTEQCRPVLLALAAGDRRRQAQLDAVRHVETCETCGSLVGPMTERRRRIAAWLFIPMAESVRRARRAFHDRWVQVATAGILVAATGGLIVLFQDHSQPQATTTGSQNSTTALRTVAPTRVATVPPPTSAAASASGSTVAQQPVTAAVTTPETVPASDALQPAPSAESAPGTTAVSAAPPTQPNGDQAPADPPPCPPPLSLSQVEVPQAIGCPFAISVVTVVSVSSGAQLSAVTGTHRAISIRLTSGGALPITIVPDVRISVTGVVNSASTSQQLAVDVNPADVNLAG
jgi:RNA polymerase sigma factor (sigma-70 family)